MNLLHTAIGAPKTHMESKEISNSFSVTCEPGGGPQDSNGDEAGYLKNAPKIPLPKTSHSANGLTVREQWRIKRRRKKQRQYQAEYRERKRQAALRAIPDAWDEILRFEAGRA